MICKGTVRGRGIVLDGEVTLPEGTRVQVIPETPVMSHTPGGPMSLIEWLHKARRGRQKLPETSDSTELLRNLREGRAPR